MFNLRFAMLILISITCSHSRAINLQNMDCYAVDNFGCFHERWHQEVVYSHYAFFSQMKTLLHGYESMSIPSSTQFVWRDASVERVALEADTIADTLSSMLYIPGVNSLPGTFNHHLDNFTIHLKSNVKGNSVLTQDWSNVTSSVYSWGNTELLYEMQNLMNSANAYFLVVYNQNSKPVASAVLFKYEAHLGVFWVGVLPKYQKQGIATWLMRQIVNASVHNNINAIVLTATPQAVSLYKKIGFIKVGDMALYLRK